jgi:hypothetical protein
MLDNGKITQAQYTAKPSGSPHDVVTKLGIESTDAPYFADHVNEQLADQFSGSGISRNPVRAFTRRLTSICSATPWRRWRMESKSDGRESFQAVQGPAV